MGQPGFTAAFREPGQPKDAGGRTWRGFHISDAPQNQQFLRTAK